MRVNVSLVVELLDDFTNKVIIKNDVKCLIPGQKAPIWKTGCFVFTNLEVGDYDVMVQSSTYQEKIFSVNLTEKIMPFYVTIRLYPSIFYKNAEENTLLSGRFLPGKTLLFYSRNVKKPLHLLSDYDKNEQDYIEFYQPQGLDFSQKSFAAVAGEKEELFFTGQKEEDYEGRYKLEKPLSYSYRKVETEILAAYEVQCNDAGQFFLLLPRGLASEINLTCLIYKDMESKVRKDIVVRAGEQNQLDLI